MQIRLEKHQKRWKTDFDQIQKELAQILAFVEPQIEHIGSTSVAGLSAKPILDIAIGLKAETNLDLVVEPLIKQGYIHYAIYNSSMPYRRFFTKHQPTTLKTDLPAIITDEKDIPKSTEEHDQRLAHVHVLILDTEHWIRHIAFRDYLKAHLPIKNAYQQLKEELSQQIWIDGNDYNRAKDAFIKEEEKKAIRWYLNQ